MGPTVSSHTALYSILGPIYHSHLQTWHLRGMERNLSEGYTAYCCYKHEIVSFLWWKKINTQICHTCFRTVDMCPFPPFRQWPQLQRGMARKGQSAFKSTCWQHPVKASRESSFPEDSVSEKGLVRGRESLSWQAAPLWTPLLYLLISSTCPKTAHPESGGLRCKAKLHNLIFLLGKTYGSTKTNMHLYLWAICQDAASVVIIGPTMVIMLLLRKNN